MGYCGKVLDGCLRRGWKGDFENEEVGREGGRERHESEGLGVVHRVPVIDFR